MKKYQLKTSLFLGCLLWVLSIATLSAQNTQEITSSKDSVPELKYNFNSGKEGGLFLTNPFKKEIIYDPVLEKYIIIERIGDVEIRRPVYMTLEEYKNYRLKKDMLLYNKEKLSALNSKKKGSADAQKNLLPKYYVNSSFFESLFGGNEIEVQPTGSVNIKMGMLYQKVDNPQLSENNRSSLTFDFDQQISASIRAKIGTRLKVNANYDTQSTFNFQNLIKLEYAPTEDDILQAIEVGNVSMPIKNSLITGAQSLFGVKTRLKFGKTTITGVFAEQKSQTRSVTAQGGTTLTEFELQTTDYDDNRHFFLSHYFRDNYNTALKNYPLINSPISITSVEVWITNSNSSTVDVRNIVALADIGESNSDNIGPATVNTYPGQIYPSNQANNIKSILTATGSVRNISTVSDGLLPFAMQQGRDYSVLENARKLLPSEYEVHPQLGYISLSRRLTDSSVLAVAFEYTVNGDSKVYKVGEFTSDGIVNPDNIVVKLLRSEILSTKIPMWDLMMKNVYALNAYNMNSEGFRLEIMYEDPETGVAVNVLQNAQTSGVEEKTLLNLIGVDRLDQSQFDTPVGDGYFDYVEDITVSSEKGYIIFPVVEPFGEDLALKLTHTDDEIYIFKELYEETKSEAKNNYQSKDKYLLKGYHKSETSNGISLNAFNIPQGSVTVTAGGRELVEGIDYVVDYQIGRVQIIDPALEASNTPINVSVENNAVFNLQTKRFFGVDIEHKFSENLLLGVTLLNLNEKTITQKSVFGQEPINNTMFGINASFATEVPKFTKWVNYLPNIDTDVVSNFSIRGDFAYLMPGSPSSIEQDGEATSYIDDFEGSQIPLEIKSTLQWHMASTPQYQTQFDLGGDAIDLSYGYQRARLAWYIIDPLFYSGGSLRPDSVDNDELSRAEVRRVRYEELFPEQDLDITQSTIVRTLDLAYYPNERGSNNYDLENVNAQGQFTNPEDRWAGITRPLTTTNFEQSNVEYIQFWLMDPFENYSITQAEGLPVGITPSDPANQVGELYFNLGNISEDILKDGRKMYENGLPGSPLSTTNTAETIWGKIPTNQSLLYAFSDDDSERLNQDIGFDGLNDAEEKIAFPAFADKEDPSSDNYMYFRSGDYDDQQASILNRYKRYNNTQGNSPTNNLSPESYPTSATTYPDTEDINKDQTMNSVESYYQYKVSLNQSDLVVGQNHIVDEKKVSVTLADGSESTSTWYQFRIQVSTPDEVINDMDGFYSIRFMRMFLTKFKIPVVLRFGELQLVRGDWRRYTKTLDETVSPSVDLNDTALQNFEVGVVNIEENENRNPIPYVLPPGIEREVLRGSTTLQEQNEQSLTIKVTELKANETRAVYKNVLLDLRMYKKLKMYLHAEAILGQVTIDNEDLTAIIRLGSDLNDNYYQIEKKLDISDFSSVTDTEIWLPDNNLEVLLEDFGKLKLQRFQDGIASNIQYPSAEGDQDQYEVDGYIIRVKGNPNLGKIKTIMLGVHNNHERFSKSGEVWFNELRIAGFDNKGGWATVISADANFADFASVSASGRMETQGFGSIEQGVNERSQEDTKSYDVVANVNLGQLLPKKWGIQLPLNVSQAEEVSDPMYDSLYQDVLFEDAEDVNPNSSNARDYTKRRSLSLLNVRKERSLESTKKPQFYNIENVSMSYAYNETFHKDYSVEKYIDKSVRAAANYNFSFEPKVIEPFKNWSFLKKSKYLDLIKDFNLSLLPTSFSVNSNIVRTFNEQTSRSLVDDLPVLPTLTQRNYLFDWDYNVGYNITKSLQFNFRAANNYVYDSFSTTDEVGLFDNFFEIGRPEKYHQSLTASYKVPLEKIPLLKFIRADYAYTADFDWQSASQSYVNEMGNTIQNSNTHTFNMDMDFKKFYKIWGITKLLNKRKPTSRKGKKGKSKAKSIGAKAGQSFYDLITAVKKIRLSYTENNGTLLPGYIPEVGFLGRDNYSGSLAPSFGFVFGSQIDIRNAAIENGWLISRNTDDAYYSKTYLQTHMEKLDFSIDIKPFKNLNIELSANKLYTSRTSQQLDVVNGVLSTDAPITEYGSYSISFNMLRTSFEDTDTTFETFKSNRTIIAQRLANKSGKSVDGYGPTSQQVALPAFLAAYSGQDANKVKTSPFRNIPIPSWQVTYKGFMKMKWFKKRFRSFSMSHSYNSLYSIVNFTNNLSYDANDPYTEKDIAGNYQNKRLYTNVNLIEEFSPLLKVSMKMKNFVSFTGQINKDKGLTLNFNNNTITQVTGTEYVVGLGYRIKDVKMRVNFGGKKTNLKGDLNFRVDLSLRDNETIIRAIDEDNDQVTGGQRLMSFKFFADYALTKSLTTSFYFDQSSSRYAISTTYPRKSVSSGISIRYILGN